MNIGNSSSVQATSSHQTDAHMRRREARTFFETYLGRERILAREPAGNDDSLTELADDFIAGLFPPSEPTDLRQQEISPDGKWLAWRDEGGDIICKPVYAKGPVKLFAGEGCKEFTFCAKSQYLIRPEVKTLSQEEVSVLQAEQRELLNDIDTFKNIATFLSGSFSVAIAGADIAIIQGALLKGFAIKLGTLLVTPIWVSAPATALAVVGTISSRNLLKKQKNEKLELLVNTQPQQKKSPQAEEELEMLAQASTDKEIYQRITLHFEPTRAEIKPQAPRIIHIKGNVSSTAFSADKKHFFTVIDEKTIKQWSTKTGKLEKSIEPCQPVDAAVSSTANKPTSITELKVSPKGKWLLLVEVDTQSTNHSAKMWLYSRKHARMQSHFELATTNGVQFEFSPCERWLAVLEGGNTLLHLTTESGEFQSTRLDAALMPIQHIRWENNELQVVGANHRVWRIISVGDALHAQLIPPLSRGTLRYSMLS